MKKHFFLAAVVFAAAIAFTVVSCQKENAPTTSNPESTVKSIYQPPKVDDMLSYLKDFKQKIQVRGNNDTMELDEASWHLSSLVNYDFGNVKNDFTGVQYDTLYNHVNVSNGLVTLSELNTAYNSISNQITDFYQTLNFDNMAPRFIDVVIEESGLVTIALMTTYRDWWTNPWYFPTVYVMDSILNSLGVGFDSCYSLYGNFNSELQRVLNILTGIQQDNQGSGKIFYVVTRTDSLMYYNYFEPNGSPFYYLYNSRIMNFLQHDSEVCYDEFAYCVDSYADLALEERDLNEAIIDWPDIDFRHRTDHLTYTYHLPKIRYGLPVIHFDPQD